MTQKIYETDAYCKKITARVISCTRANVVKVYATKTDSEDACLTQDSHLYNVVLDRTIFFPEGGGQAADMGTIDGFKVVDVQLDGDDVVHTLEMASVSPVVAEAADSAAEAADSAEEAGISAGQEVTLEIDWDVRYERMQSHSGEHIFSGIVHKLFGYDNVGFHMGDKVIEVDFSGPLKPEDVEKAECFANKAIYENAKVTVLFPTPEEAASLDYRSKIEILSGLRIVKIGEDIDCCACCAPHVALAGEVGMIKVIDAYSNKQGTRVEMIAGVRALNDYKELNYSLKRMMKLLSAPRDGVEKAVAEQYEQLKELKGQVQRMNKRLAMYELEKEYVGEVLVGCAEGLGFDELRYCANNLVEELAHGQSAGNATAEKEHAEKESAKNATAENASARICVLLSHIEGESYNYVVASEKEDVRPLVKSLNAEFSGKGGGKDNYAQGKLQAGSTDLVKNFLQAE